MLTESCVYAVGEPAAPMKDPAPQAEEQTRNQNLSDATKDPQTAQEAAAAPKVKSEKECMYLEIRLQRNASIFWTCVDDGDLICYSGT